MGCSLGYFCPVPFQGVRARFTEVKRRFTEVKPRFTEVKLHFTEVKLHFTWSEFNRIGGCYTLSARGLSRESARAPLYLIGTFFCMIFGEYLRRFAFFRVQNTSRLATILA